MSNDSQTERVKAEAKEIFKDMLDLIQTKHLDKDISSLILSSAIFDFIIVGWAIDAVGEDRAAEIHTSCSIIASEALNEAMEEIEKDLGINVKSDFGDN